MPEPDPNTSDKHKTGVILLETTLIQLSLYLRVLALLKRQACFLEGKITVGLTVLEVCVRQCWLAKEGGVDRD